MKGLYLTFDHPSSHNDSNGVWKKIQSQIKAFNNLGLNTNNFNFSISSRYLYNLLNVCLPFYFTKKTNNNFYNYDFYYIRYPLSSFAFIKLLKNINDHKKIIIIELATFPYIQEYENTASKIQLIYDFLCKYKLKKYVNIITTFSIHKKIYGIPAIQIMNGIDCSNISFINNKIKIDKSLNFIAIAMFAYWHGYDRLINGLVNYYKKEVSLNIYLHFIGYGNELNYYNELVQQNNLSKYIIFHGPQFGDKLAEIYNIADIAFCSLANHRANIYLTSELKSREYLAKGLPVISSTKIDILPDDYKYCLYLPEDESPIDINSIIDFYNKLKSEENIDQITMNIRKFAEERCDINVTMKLVVDYICKFNNKN